MMFLKQFKNDDRGQVGLIFALAAIPLMALTSAAVEYSQLTKERNAISVALDAAVLAAANNNAISNLDKDEYARTHFLANYNGGIQLKLSPSVTSARVRLAAEGKLKLSFGNIVGIDDLNVTEASAATLKTENTICVLALSEDSDGAISFDDDLVFSASQCSVHSNSTSSSAIVANTMRQKPTAASFCAVGGISGKVEPYSKGECSPVADPYVAIKPAKIGTCKSEFLYEQTQTDDIATTGGNPTSNPGGRNSLPTTNHQYSDDINLPARNPVRLGNLLREMRARRPEGYYNGQVTPLSQVGVVSALWSLSGDNLRDFLHAYDSDCSNNSIQLCTGYNNLISSAGPEAVPPHNLVADVFDISFGSYFEGEEDKLPDIVTEGLVELINGEFYSRNNIDNELVPVSTNLSGGNIVLTPGTYCGGLTVDGMRVRFTPGDYIFKDGPLTFLNKSEADADLVTFGFTGPGATLNIESGSSLDIRSAITGPRKGLAFMQMIDHSVPGNRTPVPAVNRISSGGSVTMAGTAYFPEQTLMISGEDTHLGANSPAVGLIASEVIFRGQKGARVEIGVDHVKAGVPPIQPRADDGVRLIE